MRRSLVAAFVVGVALPCAGSALAADAQKPPPVVVDFTVKIEGLGLDQDVAFFRSCGGLKVETEVVEVREGGVNDSTHKLPGRTKWANIVLTRRFRGELANEPVLQWTRATESGQTVRKNITVTLFRKDGTEAAHYHLFDC